MLGLRQKLSLGFGGLLLIILIIGIQSISHLTQLGQSIDVILRENYRSVIACQEMKESLERMDSGALFVLLGEKEKGTELIQKNEAAFEKALQAELNNITLPEEGKKAHHLQDLFNRYQATLHEMQGMKSSTNQQREAYFSKLFSLFVQIKETADEILQMNQKNMSDANDLARRRAASAKRQMYILVFAGMLVAVGFVLFTGKWILRPINRLIRSAEEIKQGNLELVVQSDSRDEIGQLSEAFNEMASALRESRRSDQTRLTRIQRATEQTFNSLPDAVAIVDPGGKVDVATETARNVFELKPGKQIRGHSSRWMDEIFTEALRTGRTILPKGEQRVIQHFVNGEEHYFRPEAIPILGRDMQPTGVVLVLEDVTQERKQEELKRGVISTVSHQLKSPLTSIRMAIYLLLEEKIGSLTPKQTELLVAAREDSDRLHSILNNLLDLSRIESGKGEMNFRRVSPHSIVFEALEPFQMDFKDRNVTLGMELQDDLPEVWADPARMNHVFANLLSNALRYTPPGGKVTVLGKVDEERVQFSVSDSGKGIPSQYLAKIFEQFFRVPDQGAETGVGLGLAIVKEIVEAHGGTVKVESRLGEGSTFIFTLRRADAGSMGEGHS
ncbi:MAG TPA: ATP-binding protein [Thermodesulfobacteriota bacterium]|nr:ATP-binding protein [Thermodesulfobacteriota bacterium]